jgi:hypothetical protein
MTATQLSAIERHGRQLLAIFPNATEQDPVKLCKALRRLEARGAALALRLCNGPEFPTEDSADKISEAILSRVSHLLGNYVYNDKEKVRITRVPIFVNRDPRGYALKICDSWMQEHGNPLSQRDWGGYGILAPEIRKDGN